MTYPHYKIPGVLLLAALQAAGISKGCAQRQKLCTEHEEHLMK